MKLSNQLAAIAVALAATATFAGAAFAVDENNLSRGATLAGPGLAVHGYDAVSFFSGQPTIGDDKFAFVYEGATYRFASQGNLDKFKASPAKYVPAYGGFCAFGTALGKKFDGDPRYWKIVDGKLYLNLNADIQSKWNEDIAGNLKKADSNWTKIRSTAVEKL